MQDFPQKMCENQKLFRTSLKKRDFLTKLSINKRFS